MKEKIGPEIACCLCDHTGDCPYYAVALRGPIVAGWTIFSDLRSRATKIGLSQEELEKLTELSDKYEKEIDGYHQKLKAIVMRLNKEELSYEEAREVIAEVHEIAIQADEVYLKAAYEGRRIIPDKVWGAFVTWAAELSRRGK
jgi:hypothetical protein